MAVTLRDVAERAGVSVRTVSNVVNDFQFVKASTRERVQAAIAELGYRPNLSARQLKHGRSGFLTLAVPQVASPYFAELAQIFTEAAAELGWIALMDVTRGEADQERLVLQGMPTHMVDGILFSPLAVKAEDFVGRRDRTPLVLLGERAVPEGYDHVTVDSVESSRAMVEHLISVGRRRVAAIGYEAFDGTSSVRLRGYREGLEAAGLPIDDSLIVGVPEYSRAEGRKAMQALLSLPEPPDAVFCFNDLMAIGALAACRQAGVRVPDDIAMAGFDNISEAEFADPPLTTISPDLGVLTREALRLLVGRIDGSRTADDAERVSVPWRLVVRESTASRG